MTESTPTTDVAVIDATGSIERSGAEERRLGALMKQCVTLAKSDLVPKALKDKPDNIFALALYGEQFGLSPIHAIQRIYIIQGTFEPKAEVLAGVIIRAGHELRWDEVSPERCTVSIRRAGTDYWQTTTWTIAQAKKAGLLDMWVERRVTRQGDRFPTTETFTVGDDDGVFSAEERARRGLPPVPEWAATLLEAGAVKRKDPWFQFPDDMLAAKALRRGGKRVAPDALLGLGDDEDRIDSFRPSAVLPAATSPADDEPVEGELVDEEPIDSNSRPLSGPASIAVALKAKGIDDRDAKLRIVEVLVGLESGSLESTKDLTAAQISAALRSIAALSEADLEEIVNDATAADAELVDEEPAAAESVPATDSDQHGAVAPDESGSGTPVARNSTPAPPAPKTDETTSNPDGWSEAAWRSFLSDRGVKVTELLREAQRLAREDGDQGPGTLEQVVASAPALKALMVGFVEDLAAQRSGS